MKVGTYYYPEQWPRQQWERDFDQIAQMGLKIVHLAEFAWGSIEPKEDAFSLDWIDDCLNMAAKRKLDVILCTPSAVLPVWMVQKHPEILMTGQRFGGRRHGRHTSSILQDYTRKVVQAMADRFGGHSSIVGWQIDNEYNGPFDQGQETHLAFQGWLKARYQTIEKLNQAWGTQFWNTFYTDWSQILLPPKRDHEYRNPHECLDASRFWSWSFAQYNKLQADILKPKIGNRWITTNFMPMHPDCDPADMRDDLSLYSWDSYPVSGWDKTPKDQTFRIADPTGIALMHDQMASYNNRWALMELQPGQVNWSGVPVLLYPGAVRLWIWSAWAHGAEFVTTYRFRQPLWGVELFHHGLMTSDGVTPSPGGRQFMQVAEEMKRIKSEDQTTTASSQPEVGLMFDFDQIWNYQTLPQARRWNYGNLLCMWYRALVRLGLRVRVIQPYQPLSKDLPMIVVPGMQMLDQEIVSRMRQYVEGGGHLLMTCRTGLMNRHGHLWEGPTAQPILSLIGGNIEAYDGLPDDTFGQVELDGIKHPWGVWGDLLYAEPGTRVLAKYADQFYAGAVAAMQKRHGKGLVTYSGVYGEQAYTDALVAKLVTEAKMPNTVLPDKVHLLQRGPYHVLLNYQDQPVQAPAGKKAKFVIGGRKVDPAGVAVWEE